MIVNLELVKGCALELVMQRLYSIENQINILKGDLLNETKSSAGDKYETARSMIYIEIEKLSNQYKEWEKMVPVLRNIVVGNALDRVSIGSFFKLDNNCYNLSVSLGKIMALGNPEVYFVSADSPIGKLVLHMAYGEWVEFRGRKLKIETI